MVLHLHVHGDVRVQVVNLRSIKPLDRETIVKSVKKTHNVVSVEEGWPQSGIGSEIVSVVVEEAFDELDSPPERITGVFTLLCAHWHSAWWPC